MKKPKIIYNGLIIVLAVFMLCFTITPIAQAKSTYLDYFNITPSGNFRTTDINSNNDMPDSKYFGAISMTDGFNSYIAEPMPGTIPFFHLQPYNFPGAQQVEVTGISNRSGEINYTVVGNATVPPYTWPVGFIHFGSGPTEDINPILLIDYLRNNNPLGSEQFDLILSLDEEMLMIRDISDNQRYITGEVMITTDYRMVGYIYDIIMNKLVLIDINDYPGYDSNNPQYYSTFGTAVNNAGQVIVTYFSPDESLCAIYQNGFFYLSWYPRNS